MKIQMLFMAFVGRVISIEPAFDYCTIPTCPRRSHTLCVYNSSEPSSRCGDVVRPYLTKEEKKIILKLHNNLRRQVYTGKEYRGAQPAAVKVTLLKWDDELEIAAQMWSLQCISETDRCRDVARFSVNQLIGEQPTLGDVEELTVEEIILKWYDEVIKFDPKYIQNFREFKANRLGTNHYTQIVWSATSRIGCASMRHFDGLTFRLRLVCNYGPRGNNDGQQIYKSIERRDFNLNFFECLSLNKP